MHIVTIDLGEVFYSFSKALDLSLTGISYHHQTVALISLAIAENLDLSNEQRQDLFFSALIHDAGLNPEVELKNVLPFEDCNTLGHCQEGYEIFAHSKLTAQVARIVRHHHDRWQGPNPPGLYGNAVPLASNIIYLADRVAVLTEFGSDYILHCHDRITSKIVENAGKIFNPMVVEAFQKASEKEAFWLDLQSGFMPDLIKLKKPHISVPAPEHELLDLTKCFSHVIDNKSPYTHNHSAKVAIVAEHLAKKMDFSYRELTLIKMAGYLHDLGKLAVPNSILDKPTSLSAEEYAIIKKHPYYTYYLLNNIPGLELVACWGSQHHEKLDGTGYPFHLNGTQLSLGSRVLAVTDIFVALTEDRPYRKRLEKRKCLHLLERLAITGQIDKWVVSLVGDYYDELVLLDLEVSLMGQV